MNPNTNPHIGYTPVGDKVYNNVQWTPNMLPWANMIIDKNWIPNPYEGAIKSGITLDEIVQWVQSIDDLVQRFVDHPALFEMFMKTLANLVMSAMNNMQNNGTNNLVPLPSNQVAPTDLSTNPIQ